MTTATAASATKIIEMSPEPKFVLGFGFWFVFGFSRTGLFERLLNVFALFHLFDFGA